MPDDVMVVRGVAHYLKLSHITVHKMAEQGKLPGIKIGVQWRFRKAEVERVFERAGA